MVQRKKVGPLSPEDKERQAMEKREGKGLEEKISGQVLEGESEMVTGHPRGDINKCFCQNAGFCSK